MSIEGRVSHIERELRDLKGIIERREEREQAKPSEGTACPMVKIGDNIRVSATWTTSGVTRNVIGLKYNSNIQGCCQNIDKLQLLHCEDDRYYNPGNTMTVDCDKCPLKDKPVPLIEQEWRCDEIEVDLVGHQYWKIWDPEGWLIVVAHTPEMRDIIMGIPALVKACRGCLDETIQCDYKGVRTSLNAMGIGDDE